VDIVREPKSKKGRYILIGLAVVALAAITVLLRNLEPAAPTVDADTIWTGTVERGPMLRQVRGPGTLVPEDIVYISARTAGRVERVLVQPGTAVTPEVILLELSNPNVELDALEAARQLSAAEADLTNLRGTLETGILSQQAAVARTRNEYRDAVRRLDAYREVPQEVSQLELERTQDQVEELQKRLEIDQRTLEVRQQGRDVQIQVQQSQVERLKDLAEFRRNLVRSMKMAAGVTGVVRTLELEVGQWVNAGSPLGVIIQPGRLRAEVRINEIQATDVVLNLPAEVDTRRGKVPGHISRIDPSATGGTVRVDIALDGMVPEGARADQSVEGIITLERLEDVLYMGRPTIGQANTTIGLFKLVDDGNYAVRVSVELGQTSVDKVEVKRGLQQGDVVILSDMARWDNFDRVRIRR
jgi:HlyD family secretion protein